MINKEIIYKYKSFNEQDRTALLESKIWVPIFRSLNDPSDPFWFLKHDDGVLYNGFDDDEYQKIIDEVVRKNFCLSFSNNYDNPILWNYYSDGMRGVVLGYSKNELLSKMKRRVSSVCAKKVIYRDNKINIYEFLPNLKNGEYTFRQISKFLFYKGKTWKKEDEFRIIGENHEYANGFSLEDILPKEIFIGWKMEDKTRKELILFCKNNNIDVYEAAKSICFEKDFPDFCKIDLNEIEW